MPVMRRIEGKNDRIMICDDCVEKDPEKRKRILESVLEMIEVSSVFENVLK